MKSSFEVKNVGNSVIRRSDQAQISTIMVFGVTGCDAFLADTDVIVADYWLGYRSTALQHSTRSNWRASFRGARGLVMINIGIDGPP